MQISLDHLDIFLATYSVCVPHLPAGSMQNMSDLRSSSFNDPLTNQIPQNTTYQLPSFQSEASPGSLSPSSVASQGKEF